MSFITPSGFLLNCDAKIRISFEYKERSRIIFYKKVHLWKLFIQKAED